MHPAAWYTPTMNTPDYIPQSVGFGCVMPNGSGWGADDYSNGHGFQLPHSGRFFAGFLTGTSDREYIAVKLLDSLKPNTIYCLEFFLSLSEGSGFSRDGIGIALSADSIYDYTIGDNPIPGLMFVAGNPSGNNLSDTMNWMLVCDTFIATGGEQYLIFGNVRPDSMTNIYPSFGASASTYFWVDDISLIEIKSADAGINTTICENDSLQLGTTPLLGAIYSWQPVTGLSDPAIANPKAAPATTTTYTVMQTFCSVQLTASVTITVNPDCDEPYYSATMVIPNPNNGEMACSYNLPEGGMLEIFNMLGQIVLSIELPPGHRLESFWLPVADGVYMWRVRSGDIIAGEGKICILGN